jgi:hypothetical protein
MHGWYLWGEKNSKRLFKWNSTGETQFALSWEHEPTNRNHGKPGKPILYPVSIG